MDNKENLVDWFVKGTFFSKQFPVNSNKPKGELCRLSIENEDDVRLAVNKAYLDMTPRTIKTQEGNEKQDIDPKKKDEVLTNLTKSIKTYIENGNYSDFEINHKELCNNFKNDFNNNVLKPANRKFVADGKSQKIVNMTFKYLYCFDDAENYIELFEKSHMAIDSYIIEWYNNNVAKTREDRITDSWSNLKYDDTNSAKTYIAIQKNIKKYLKSDENKKYPKIPFFAEFIIWQEEKAKAVKKENKKQNKNL